MKKLGKLKLNKFNEMNDSEMRNIVGGYDENPSQGRCASGETEYTCTISPSGFVSTTGAVCAKTTSEAITKAEKTASDPYSYGTVAVRVSCGLH